MPQLGKLASAPSSACLLEIYSAQKNTIYKECEETVFLVWKTKKKKKYGINFELELLSQGSAHPQFSSLNAIN